MCVFDIVLDQYTNKLLKTFFRNLSDCNFGDKIRWLTFWPKTVFGDMLPSQNPIVSEVQKNMGGGKSSWGKVHQCRVRSVFSKGTVFFFLVKLRYRLLEVTVVLTSQPFRCMLIFSSCQKFSKKIHKFGTLKSARESPWVLMGQQKLQFCWETVFLVLISCSK